MNFDFENNVPVDADMDQVFSPNEKAQALIEKSAELQSKYKKVVLSHLLDSINEICKEQNIQYFAISRLLAEYVTGADTFPDNLVYNIAMMRGDFDKFFTAANAHKKKLGIKVAQYYNSHGQVTRVFSNVSRKEEFPSEIGTISINMTIRIDPYDMLPDQEDEREAFIRSQGLVGGEYRRLSRFFTSGTGVTKKTSHYKRGIMNRIANYKRKKAEKKLYARLEELKKIYPAMVRKYQNEKTHTAGRIELLYYRPHDLKEILPIRTVPLYDSQLMIPAVTDRFMIGTLEDEAAHAVSGRMKALKEFDELCREHSLTYFMMEGISSGATHYQNYAEGSELSDWDVGMLREDFDKAVSLISAIRGEEDEDYLTMRICREEFPAVHSEDVGFIMKSQLKLVPFDRDYPIKLYPFDAIPDDRDELASFMEEVLEADKMIKRVINSEKGLKYYEPEELPGMDSWQCYEKTQEIRRRFNSPGEAPVRVFTLYHGKVVFYPYDEIMPAERRQLGELSLLAPANPYLWHYKKDAEFTDYIAGKRTELLRIFDEICQNQGFEYFAIASLLIGAAIYQDAVPESDDAAYDLALLRRDYEKCLQYLREHGQEHGIQLNEYYDPAHRYPRQTKTITYCGHEYSTLVIRVIPFDKVPEDFYLSEGFKDDIIRNNERYNKLIEYRCRFHRFDAKKMNLTEEEYNEYLHYLQTADAAAEAARFDSFAQTFNDDERWDTYGRVSLGRSKTISGSELFPLQRVKFRDIMINIPNDYSVWQPMLNAELERQVAAIQRADILLMKEFDRVCQELGVGYFVCGGTMLGYMRHGGFIPWDDDVDCAMLRKDYDRFLAEAGPLLKEGYFLQTRKSDPNIPYLFSKLRLDNTEYATEYNAERDFHIGICLDIFPFDYIPDDPDERKSFRNQVRELSKAHNEVANNQLPYPKEVCEPRNELEARYIREQKEKLDYFWSKDLKETQEAYLSCATAFNEDGEAGNLKTVASFVPSYTFIDVDNLLPYQRGKFEDIEVSVPKRPDIFLKMQYKDYMTLPPKHNQVAHRLVRWSTWEESWDKKPEETAQTAEASPEKEENKV